VGGREVEVGGVGIGRREAMRLTDHAGTSPKKEFRLIKKKTRKIRNTTTRLVQKKEKRSQGRRHCMFFFFPQILPNYKTPAKFLRSVSKIRSR
jgi:hypothetical protein